MHNRAYVARVMELVDITDLKSVELYRSCRFKSGRGYHFSYSIQDSSRT